MGDGKWSIVGNLVLYVAVPILAVYLLFEVVKGWIGGNQAAVDESARQVAIIWDEYNEERKEFLLNDGVIDANEQSLLDAKLGLVRQHVELLQKTVTDFNALTVFGMTCIVAYYALKAVGYPLMKSYLDRAKNNANKPDATADGASTAQATAEELEVIMNISTAMELADLGHTALASNSLTAIQNSYAVSTIPKMQIAFTTITHQLPLLTGVQLQCAQFMLAQYNYYLAYYVAVLPPIITIVPPIIPF